MGIPYIKKVKSVLTYDKNGKNNGWLHLLVNQCDKDEYPIEQAYLAYCTPGEVKGPHMHHGNKWDRITCIQGEVILVCRDEDTQIIYEFPMSTLDQQILYIPPNTSHGFVSRHGCVLLSITSEGYKINQIPNQVETVYSSYDWNKWLNA